MDELTVNECCQERHVDKRKKARGRVFGIIEVGLFGSKERLRIARRKGICALYTQITVTVLSSYGALGRNMLLDASGFKLVTDKRAP
jgi:hypothetical protein